MTSIRKFLSRAALGTFVASLFFASTSHAQVRQTQLFIDDGGGNFNILKATLGTGGIYMFPGIGGTNTLITTGNLTSITEVGTISSGIWEGTPISAAYGGTGVNNTSVATNLFFAGPNGSTGPATFRLIAPADLPIATTSALGAVQADGTTIAISGGVISTIGAAPTGNAGGDLANTYPNPTINTTSATTGAHIVTAINAGAGVINVANGGTGAATVATGNEVFASPNGGSGAPGFRALVDADLPSDLGTEYIQNTNSQQASSNFNISGNGTIAGVLNATGSIQNTTSNPLLISTVNGELTTIGNPTGTTTMPGTVNATGSIQNTTSNPLLISTVNGELTTIGNPTGTTTMPGIVNATGSIQNTTSNPLLISTVNGELTTIGNPTGTTTMPGIVNATGSIQNTTSNPLLISTANGETTTIGNPTGTTTMPGIVNATGSIQNTTSNPLLISTANGETTTIGNLTGTTTIQGPGVDLPGLTSAAPSNGYLALNGSNQVVISNAAVVSGSGTANTIPIWEAGGATLGDSKLTDNGTDLVYNALFDVSSTGGVSGVTTLTSSGNTTVGTGASTTNTFGNGGSATNSIGDGASSSNTFGSVGGSITNSFGDGASAINTFGIGASASNTIGSTGTSITTILGGTGVGINNADTSSGPTNIGNGASTGSVGIGNTTGGVTITSTNWSASGAALTAGGTATAGSLVITDGVGGNTNTLEAAASGIGSPIFQFPAEATGTYTLATTGDIAADAIQNSYGTTFPQGTASFDIWNYGVGGKADTTAIIINASDQVGVNSASLSLRDSTYGPGPDVGQHVGLNFQVNQGATNTDIIGTSNSWNVASNGGASFATLSASSAQANGSVATINNTGDGTGNTATQLSLTDATSAGLGEHVGLKIAVGNGLTNYDIKGDGWSVDGLGDIETAGYINVTGATGAVENESGTLDIQTGGNALTLGNSVGITMAGPLTFDNTEPNDITGSGVIPTWSVTNAGAATFATVTSTSDVSTGGHIISTGAINSTVTGGGDVTGTPTVTGSDVAGTVTFSTTEVNGTGSVALTFGNAFTGTAPVVILTQNGPNGVGVITQVYVSSVTRNGFTINFADGTSVAGVEFNYIVVQP